jgi:flagellar biosynthesis/type III secretory pathway M-ring protein FliF/YscJ
MFDIRWVPVAFVVVVLLLVFALARMVGNARRRRIRKSLGLPENSRLSEKEAQAFRAFEDTDMKLRKTFPKMSDTQRRVIARDVLRDKGILPRKK